MGSLPSHWGCCWVMEVSVMLDKKTTCSVNTCTLFRYFWKYFLYDGRGVSNLGSWHRQLQSNCVVAWSVVLLRTKATSHRPKEHEDFKPRAGAGLSLTSSPPFPRSREEVQTAVEKTTEKFFCHITKDQVHTFPLFCMKIPALWKTSRNKNCTHKCIHFPAILRWLSSFVLQQDKDCGLFVCLF